MDVHEPNETNKPQGGQQLVTLLQVVAGLSSTVLLIVRDWGALSLPLRIVVVALASAAILPAATKRLFRSLHDYREAKIEHRYRQMVVTEFRLLLEEAEILLDLRHGYSFRNYINVIRLDSQQDPGAKANLNQLFHNATLLSDWDSTLLVLIEQDPRELEMFLRVIRSIARFYNDWSDVVREFVRIKLPDSQTTSSHEADRSKLKEKLNLHFSLVERQFHDTKRAYSSVPSLSLDRIN